jgi:hypothetical protein
MKQRSFLAYYANIADIQSTRLKDALIQVNKLHPFSAAVLANLPTDKLAFLDMLTTRFGKLQDIIGSKIFPIILNLLEEDAVAFIDKLNKLEKLGYIEDANWWIELREIRNKIAHDYPDDHDLICSHISVVIVKAAELIEFWQKLKTKIARL